MHFTVKSLCIDYTAQCALHSSIERRQELTHLCIKVVRIITSKCIKLQNTYRVQTSAKRRQRRIPSHVSSFAISQQNFNIIIHSAVVKLGSRSQNLNRWLRHHHQHHHHHHHVYYELTNRN